MEMEYRLKDLTALTVQAQPRQLARSPLLLVSSVNVMLNNIHKSSHKYFTLSRFMLKQQKIFIQEAKNIKC